MKLAAFLAAAALLPLFAFAEENQPNVGNPITVSGPIREVTRDGDNVTIWLVRNKYPVSARAWLPVQRTGQGRKMYAADLIVGDSLEVHGDLERNVVYAEKIRLLLRVERR